MGNTRHAWFRLFSMAPGFLQVKAEPGAVSASNLYGIQKYSVPSPINQQFKKKFPEFINGCTKYTILSSCRARDRVLFIPLGLIYTFWKCNLSIIEHFIHYDAF